MALPVSAQPPRGDEARRAGTLPVGGRASAASPAVRWEEIVRGPEPVGPMVRRLRLRADLTLERLAELSGISDRALSDIERGVVGGPQRRTVLAIAQALHLSAEARASMIHAARAGRRRRQPPRGWPPLPALRAVPDFTARGEELARITAALRRPLPPVVVLTGPPGYGKTSLAVTGANLLRERFSEQLLVSLGGTSSHPPSADEVADRVLQSLTGQRCTRGRSQVQLQQGLDDRAPLLVLEDRKSVG